MPRYRLTIEYDGRGFVGWQRQQNGLGVQQVLEDAVTALSGETQLVQCAGRTDAGVHALKQIAHVDIEKDLDTDTVRDALNYHVRPHLVAVLAVEIAADDFNARFSATGRAYRYRILNRRAPPTLEAGRAWWVPTPLLSPLMHEAAQVLIGNHDFTSFRAAECQASSPEKTLDVLNVSQSGDEIVVEAKARSFLYHQVRNMVGTLRLVGEGKWTADDVKAALVARDRRAAGPSAPAEGLYLTGVSY